MPKLYPFELPSTIHPLAWVFLAFGLDQKLVNDLAKHVFDDLGARLLVDEPRSVVASFAVDWPFEKDGYIAALTGEEVRLTVAPFGAVRIVEGHLPPGLKLERHTGDIVGTIREAGLYSATIEIGPRVKFDPLGGNGSPDSGGTWIPINQPRMEPDPVVVPTTLNDLDELQLDQLQADIQRAIRAKQVRDADVGGEVPGDGHSSE